ncbi:hypothetical protein HOF92_06295 [bacterium]|jgi:hypothetical protein|nr:hypothetical protein [bacterium]
MQKDLDDKDLLIVQRPVDEFEDFVKKQVQIQSKFGEDSLELYFEALDMGKNLIEESEV